MTPADQPRAKPHPRRDGWMPPRRRAFLDALGAGLDVTRACVRAGLSRRSAYNLRARDAGFARAWEAALRSARAEEERAFRAAVARMFPALADLAEDGPARESGLLPQDSVTSVTLV